MLQTIFNGEAIQVYTEKTVKTIEKYKLKFDTLEAQEKHYREEAAKQTHTSEVKRFYYDKANQVDGKKWKIIEKVDDIKKDRLTNGEVKKIIRESSSFQSLQRGTSIGVRTYTKIGFSKYLGTYIKIEYTYFNSFMKGVKGCAGMANTYSLNSLIILSDEEFKALTEQPKVVTAFGAVVKEN